MYAVQIGRLNASMIKQKTNKQGIQPGGLQCEVRRPRKSAGVGYPTTANPGTGHDLHGCPGSRQADGLGGAWPRPAVRTPGEETHRHTAEGPAWLPGITIEIQWCPAHNGIAGNEKADEWAKIAAEEPDARGVEWLSYLDRAEARAMPLPRSLANIKRKISEKKWVKGRQRAGGRTSKTKYRMPKSQSPDGTVAGSSERLASRFYQVKTGHCLLLGSTSTGRRTGPPRSAGCRYQIQTREHSRYVLSGRPNRRSCGRSFGRRLGSGRAGVRSGTSWQVGSAVRWCWASSLLQMWGNECRLRKKRRVRRRNGSSGSAGSGRKRGRRRRRS